MTRLLIGTLAKQRHSSLLGGNRMRSICTPRLGVIRGRSFDEAAVECLVTARTQRAGRPRLDIKEQCYIDRSQALGRPEADLDIAAQ